MKGLDDWITNGDLMTCCECGRKYYTAHGCECPEGGSCDTCDHCDGGMCALDGSFVEPHEGCDDWRNG